LKRGLIRLLLYFLGRRAKQSALREVRRRGLLIYLRALRGTRRAFIVFLAALLVSQLMLLALVGAVVTGFLLWDADFEFKMEVLFIIFSLLFAVPAAVLGVLLSGRLWYRLSGAKKMVDDYNRAA
jgi:hypothetical protein